MNRPTAPISTASPLFQQALQEDSNHILDWLWYAGQLSSEGEIRYCYERILYIDPRNQQAIQAVIRLDARQKRSTQSAPAAAVNPIGRLFQVLLNRA